MGLIDSPYHECLAMPCDNGMVMGNRRYQYNNVGWVIVVSNLLWKDIYIFYQPWIYKDRGCGYIVTDLFVHLD